MYYLINAVSLSEAIEKSMKSLYKHAIMQKRENQDREEMMKEIQLVINIENPLASPPISKAMPCDIHALISYEDEFLNGSADDLGWKYTYHQLYSPFYEKVLSEIRRNKATRRACIALGQGNINFTPDPPCLQLLMVNIVDNTVELSAVFRSNDGVKAFPMNIQAIAALQRKLSGDLDIPVGAMHYIANNFHAYNRDFETLESYISLFDKYKDRPERKTYSWEQYEKAKETFYQK